MKYIYLSLISLLFCTSCVMRQPTIASLTSTTTNIKNTVSSKIFQNDWQQDYNNSLSGAIIIESIHDPTLATVTLSELGVSTNVRSDATYYFSNVVPGEYLIEISHPYHQISYIKSQIKEGSDTTAKEITLTPSSGSITGTMTLPSSVSSQTTISIAALSLQITPESDGSFTLVGIPPGDHIVTFSHTNCQPASSLISIYYNETKTLSITLEEN